MRVIKQYQCEYCNKVYKDEQQAKKCEVICQRKKEQGFNYFLTLDQYYTPLGYERVIANEAYHIQHGKDMGLFQDIIFDILGGSYHELDHPLGLDECDEFIMEANERYENDIGYYTLPKLYTTDEWSKRIGGLLPDKLK